jgi:hypothetical protein
MPDEKPNYACTCPALDHDHKWGSQCSRRGTYAGGVCYECRYWHTYPERKDNL